MLQRRKLEEIKEQLKILFKFSFKILLKEKLWYILLYYRIAGFFHGPIFSRIANGANFAKNIYIFAIRPKPDHTHAGALRKEGEAPKFLQNIFLRK